MSFELVGREEELAAVAGFLEEPHDGPAVLVLEGEAGIGKSTLWQAAADDARARGLTVLASRPAEAERSLAHAGLGDLLEHVADETLPRLSAPRRRALHVTLLQDEADEPVDDRALAVAVRDVLRLLAEPGPLVVAIDDVQWLDASTARVLSFVLRRLTTEPVAVVATLRIGSGAPAEPLGLDRAMPTLVRIAVGPMPEDPLGREPVVRAGDLASRGPNGSPHGPRHTAPGPRRSPATSVRPSRGTASRGERRLVDRCGGLAADDGSGPRGFSLDGRGESGAGGC
jgi:hypothetical protein